MTSKNQSPPDAPVIILGDQSASGTYLLRISAHTALSLAFGRFKSGKVFDLPAGDYLYIGSAMGGKLSSRLLRHTTRTAGKSPHPIREAFIQRLSEMELPIPCIRAKHLHWHIDYLLDGETVELTGIMAMHTEARLECLLADRIEQLPGVQIIEQGLGASDWPGHTHLLRLGSSTSWAVITDSAHCFMAKPRQMADCWPLD